MIASESVGFWAGLISSVVGTVLSIVAIIFSILVDRRSSSISDKTIQSLQKIESAVERSSSDTRELIKAGWDKMLGNVEKTPDQSSGESSAKRIAAGIAAELRSELKSLSSDEESNGNDSKTKIAELEQYLKSLEASLSAQLKAARSSDRPSTRFSDISDKLRLLSKPALALLISIVKHHLSQTQYKRLVMTELGSSLLELRESGLLVPVIHRVDGEDEPCYYFPPGASRMIRAAVATLPKPPEVLRKQVRAELRKIGYITQDLGNDEG